MDFHNTQQPPYSPFFKGEFLWDFLILIFYPFNLRKTHFLIRAIRLTQVDTIYCG
jgi:hypothetical protein